MKTNFYPFLQAVCEDLKNNLPEYVKRFDKWDLFDTLINVREDMIEGYEEWKNNPNPRIYNQFRNDSCKRLFENNPDLRLFDFTEFLHENTCTYFKVEQGRELVILQLEEVWSILLEDLFCIVQYVMENPFRNEDVKKVYMELIAKNI